MYEPIVIRNFSNVTDLSFLVMDVSDRKISLNTIMRLFALAQDYDSLVSYLARQYLRC